LSTYREVITPSRFLNLFISFYGSRLLLSECNQTVTVPVTNGRQEETNSKRNRHRHRQNSPIKSHVTKCLMIPTLACLAISGFVATVCPENKLLCFFHLLRIDGTSFTMTSLPKMSSPLSITHLLSSTRCGGRWSFLGNG
jgi:hypothetical protein